MSQPHSLKLGLDNGGPQSGALGSGGSLIGSLASGGPQSNPTPGPRPQSLRLGLEAGGGVLPGPQDLIPPSLRGGMLQTPVCEVRSPGTPGGPPGGLGTPGAPPAGLELGPMSTASNGGAPTLTTPTLTPTTLRNIEQMFAESDPHEPPHQYQHAAGFAPPIISPTSGNSYVPLGQGPPSQILPGPQNLPPHIPPDVGQTTPLNCHRPPSPSSISGPPSLCPVPPKPPRPTNLLLSRPPPLLEAPLTRRGQSSCLLPPQQQAKDLSLPSPTRGDLSISLVKPQQVPEKPQVPLSLQLERPPPAFHLERQAPSLQLERQAPTLQLDKPHILKDPGDQPPPGNVALTGANPTNSALAGANPTNISLTVAKPTNLSLSGTSPRDLSGMAATNPKDLSAVAGSNTSNIALPLAGANLLSHKIDMMDKLLKAVAASATAQGPVGPVAKTEPVEPVQSPPPPAYRSETETGHINVGAQGGKKASENGSALTDEEGRRAMRRERNKQAAARCRKRRMDLTSTLQVEVDQWEEKVRGLKEELLHLESQKKGLEAVLKRHQGPCKINKQQN